MPKTSNQSGSINVCTITFEINAVDLYAMRRYEQFIRKCAKEGKSVPARVIKKFLSFFRAGINQEYDSLSYQKKQLDGLLLQIKNNLCKRFECNKEYNFLFFKAMVDVVFENLSEHLFVLWNNTDYNKRKEIVIQAVYNNINDYFTEGIGVKYDESFGKYKRCVLCAYIVFGLGFHLSQKITPKQLNGQEPSNQLLYESIKYYIGRIP